MLEFIHSVLVPNESISAGDIKSYDLPVQPLSFAAVTVKFAQNVANTQLAFANIAAMLSRVEALYKGSAMFSLNGLDMLACGRLICGFESWGINNSGDDNELRSMTFLVPFGRKLYDPMECYPPSTRGEFVLQITFAASFTEIDGVSLQVETVVLPGATPEKFLRMTTLSKTPTASGEDSIALPLGNEISDLVLWGTTIPSGATATTTIKSVQVELDELERYYSKAFFETLHNLAGRTLPAPGYWGTHIHQLDDAAYAQYMDSGAVKAANHVLSNHLLVPFDIHRDGQFILDTSGLKSCELVIDFGDTNAVRVIPCELMKAGRAV